MFHSAKRETRIRCDHLVDKYAAGFDLVNEPLLFGGVTCPNARCKPERRLVRNADCLIHVAHSKEHGDRTKQFFSIRRVPAIDICQYCWRAEIARPLQPLPPG